MFKALARWIAYHTRLGIYLVEREKHNLIVEALSRRIDMLLKELNK